MPQLNHNMPECPDHCDCSPDYRNSCETGLRKHYQSIIAEKDQRMIQKSQHLQKRIEEHKFIQQQITRGYFSYTVTSEDQYIMCVNVVVEK